MIALSIHKSSDRSLALSRQHVASFNQQASFRTCKIKHILVKAIKQGLGVLMSVWIVLDCFFAALVLAFCSYSTSASPPMWSVWVVIIEVMLMIRLPERNVHRKDSQMVQPGDFG